MSSSAPKEHYEKGYYVFNGGGTTEGDYMVQFYQKLDGIKAKNVLYTGVITAHVGKTQTDEASHRTMPMSGSTSLMTVGTVALVCLGLMMAVLLIPFRRSERD